MKLPITFRRLSNSTRRKRGDDISTDLLIDSLRTYVSDLENSDLRLCSSNGSCAFFINEIEFILFVDGPDDVCMQAMFAQVRPLPPKCVQKLKVWKVNVDWNYHNQARVSRHVGSSLLCDPTAFRRRLDSFVILSKTLAERRQVKRV